MAPPNMYGLGGSIQPLSTPAPDVSRMRTTNEDRYLSGESRVGRTQDELAKMLMARARGEGPSVAEMTLRNQTQRNIAGVASQLGSQRGLNPAQAARTAGYAQAQMQQEAAGQGSMLRAQEQQQAQEALARALQAQRGQDISQQQTYQQGAQNALAAQLQGRGQDIQDLISQRGITAEQASQLAGYQRQDETWLRDLLAGMAGQAVNTAAGVGMKVATAGLAYTGGMVPGKRKMKGDHPSNDVYNYMLAAGEGVIPASIMEAPDAGDRAKKFVEALKGLKPKKGASKKKKMDEDEEDDD